MSCSCAAAATVSTSRLSIPSCVATWREQVHDRLRAGRRRSGHARASSRRARRRRRPVPALGVMLGSVVDAHLAAAAAERAGAVDAGLRGGEQVAELCPGHVQRDAGRYGDESGAGEVASFASSSIRRSQQERAPSRSVAGMTTRDLVGARAPEDVAGARQAAQARGDADQRGVAGRAPAARVELTEAVDVDHGGAERAAACARTRGASARRTRGTRRAREAGCAGRGSVSPAAWPRGPDRVLRFGQLASKLGALVRAP